MPLKTTPPINPRSRMRLDGVWRFQVDPFNAGEIAGYAREDCDVSGWRTVGVPSGFESCGPGLATYQGFGWFQRTFTVPAGWEGRRILLCFAGVNFQAAVWLNGQLLGEHHGRLSPFCLSHGAVAALWRGECAGGARGRRAASGRSARAGTWLAAHRRHLARSDAAGHRVSAHLDNVRIIADADGSFQVQMAGENGHESEITAQRLPSLRDEAGSLLAQTHGASVVPAARKSSCVVLAGRRRGGDPWCPDRPVVYTARLELRADKTTDRCAGHPLWVSSR